MHRVNGELLTLISCQLHFLVEKAGMDQQFHTWLVVMACHYGTGHLSLLEDIR